MKLLEQFPILGQILKEPINLVKARSIVPGLLGKLTALERGLELTDEQIKLLHAKADGNSVLTNKQMALLKQDPLKFLAEYPDSALAFDDSNLRRGVTVGVGHDYGVGITYKGEDGKSEEIIVFPNSTDRIARHTLSSRPGDPEGVTRPEISFDYLSRVDGDYSVGQKARNTLELITTAIAA